MIKENLKDRTNTEKKNDMDQWTRRNGVMKFTLSSANELARKIDSKIPAVDNLESNRRKENAESVAMVIETTQNILDDCVNAENEVEKEIEKEVEKEIEKEVEKEIEKEAEKEVEKEAEEEVEEEAEIEKDVSEEEDVEIINVDQQKEEGNDSGKEKEKKMEVVIEKNTPEESQQNLINVQDGDDDVAIIVPSKGPKLSSSHKKARSQSKKPSTSTGIIYTTSPRPVEQLDMFTKEVVRRYESHGHASRLMNISSMAMTQCCGNQLLSAGNFSWRESLIVSSTGKKWRGEGWGRVLLDWLEWGEVIHVYSS